MENRKPVIYIFLLALFVRIVYLYEMVVSPYFGSPFLDELYHYQWANEIASINFIGSSVFFRAPLYSYLLGLVFKIFGNDLFLPLLLQHIAGCVTVVYIILLTSKIASQRTAIIAGILAAVYAPMFFNENQLFDTAFAILLFTMSVYYLVCFLQNNNIKTLLIAGFLSGLGAITRPNILLFVILIPVLFILIRKSLEVPLSGKSILKFSIIFFIAVLIPVLPVTIRNAVIGKTFVPIATFGGINFYIGNNPNADGFTARTAKHYQFVGKYRDSVELFAEKEAENITGRKMSAAEIQSFWVKRSLNFFIKSPLSAAKLTLKKTIIFFTRIEIKNNKNIYFVSDYSFILKFLLTIFHFGILLPLTLAGIWFAFTAAHYSDKRSINLLLIIYLISQAASVIIFFVSDRHRLPVTSIMFSFAAIAINEASEIIKKKTFSKLLIPCFLIILPSAVLSNVDWFGVKIKDLSRDYWSVGNCYNEKREFEQALKAYSKALEYNPKDPDILNNIGEVFYNTKNQEKAEEYFHKAIEADPAYLKALNNLGVISEDRKDYTKASSYYLKVLELEPDHYLCRTNYGDVLLKINKTEQALSEYEKVLEKSPDFVNALIGAGKASITLQNNEKADKYLSKALSIGGEGLKKYLMENDALLSDYIKNKHE